MSTLTDWPSRFYLESEMDQPELIGFTGGNLLAFSRVCPGKSEPNDDSAAVIRTAAGAIVLVVADGVGGAPMGYKASAIAITCISESLEQESSATDLRPAILNGIEKANAEILDMGTGAATTLTVVEVNDRVSRGYQVGDSMALILGQRGAIKWKSRCHSPVGYAIDSGMLDERDAMHHDERHFVSNLVGTREMYIDVGPAVSLAPRDSIVLGSDGLFDNLHLDEINNLSRVGRPLDRINALVKLATQRMQCLDDAYPGKPDDMAIVMLTP